MEKGKAHAKPPRSQAVEFSVLSLPGWTVERVEADPTLTGRKPREGSRIFQFGRQRTLEIQTWEARSHCDQGRGVCKICFAPAATSSAHDAHFRQYRILREEGWEIRDGCGVCKDKAFGQNERKGLSKLRGSFAASSSKKIRRLLDRGYAFCRCRTCLLPYRSSDHCIGTVALDQASDVLALSGMLGRCWHCNLNSLSSCCSRVLRGESPAPPHPPGGLELAPMSFRSILIP